MTNSSHENLIAGYVLGDLTTEEVAEFHQLLALHPEILAAVDQFQEVLSLLPLALPEDYPSPKLKARILAVAGQDKPSVAAEGAVNASKSLKISQYFWAGLVTVILAIVGFDSYTTKKQLAIAKQELSGYQEAIAVFKQPSNRLFALKSTTNASGSLIIARSSKSGVLALQNLPMPPQNMYYCLWALVDGKKAYIAEFKPDANGVVMLKFTINANLVNTKSVAITLEPKQVVPESQGKMVMQGELSL